MNYDLSTVETVQTCIDNVLDGSDYTGVTLEYSTLEEHASREECDRVSLVLILADSDEENYRSVLQIFNMKAVDVKHLRRLALQPM